MRKLALIFLLLVSPLALSSTTRTLDVDALISSDHTKSYGLPSASDTLVGRASTDTLTNKSISGSTNTFTNIPANTALTNQTGVANGGTGLSTLTSGSVLVGAGTSAVSLVAPGSSGNVLTSNGSTWTSSAASSGGNVTSYGIQTLTNPGFETGTSATGWTITTVTGANETSTIFEGVNSEKLTYSSSTGGISQSNTPTVNTNSVNMEASCRVLTTMTTIEVCGLSGGTKQNCQSVPSSGTWQYVAAAFPGPSNGTSVGVQVDTTASGSGTVYVDNCYVGPSRVTGTGGVDTPFSTAISFTPTAAFGTVTNNIWYTRRIGDSLQVHGSFTVGTINSSFGAALTLPTGYVIDSTKISSAGQIVGIGSNTLAQTLTVNNNLAYIFYDGSDTANLYFTTSGSGSGFSKTTIGNLAGSNVPYFADFTIPIKQFTDQALYRADATPASWSGYDTFSSGWSTSSNGAFADFSSGSGITLTKTTSRNVSCVANASSLAGIDCSLSRSGMHNVCASFSFADGSTETPSIRLVDGSGNIIDPGKSVTATAGYYYTMSLCGIYNATSLGTTFKLQGATQGGTLSIKQGSVTGVSAIQWTVAEYDAPMPAPYLTGSLTSSDSKSGYHVETIVVNNSSGSCSITNQSGSWASSVSHTATGQCTVTTADFSATPICVCSGYAGSGAGNARPCNFDPGSSSATSLVFDTVSSAFSAVDIPFTAMCMGLR